MCAFEVAFLGLPSSASLRNGRKGFRFLFPVLLLGSARPKLQLLVSCILISCVRDFLSLLNSSLCLGFFAPLIFVFVDGVLVPRASYRPVGGGLDVLPAVGFLFLNSCLPCRGFSLLLLS